MRAPLLGLLLASLLSPAAQAGDEPFSDIADEGLESVLWSPEPEAVGTDEVFSHGVESAANNNNGPPVPVKNWLDNDASPLDADGKIKALYVNRLVDSMKTQPEVMEILEDALNHAKVNFPKTQELRDFLKICDWQWGQLNEDGSRNWTQGLTRSSWGVEVQLAQPKLLASEKRVELQKSYKEQMEKWLNERFKIDGLKFKELPSKLRHGAKVFFDNDTRKHPGYVQFVNRRSLDVCLAPNLDEPTAASVLAHELAHFRNPGGDLFVRPDRVADVDEAIQYGLSAKGGEGEAFKVGFLAALTLAGPKPTSIKRLPMAVRPLYALKNGQWQYVGKDEPLFAQELKHETEALAATPVRIGTRFDPLLSKYIVEENGYRPALIQGYYENLLFFRKLYAGVHGHPTQPEKKGIYDLMQSYLKYYPAPSKTRDEIVESSQQIKDYVAALDQKVEAATQAYAALFGPADGSAASLPAAAARRVAESEELNTIRFRYLPR
jgi:hypothetical protein